MTVITCSAAGGQPSGLSVLTASALVDLADRHLAVTFAVPESTAGWACDLEGGLEVRRGVRVAAWMLLALAVLAVAVIVPVGALRAHDTEEFNRWVGLATVAAVPLAAGPDPIRCSGPRSLPA